MDVLVERRTKLLQAFKEVGSNVVAKFAIFRESIVLILIEPAAKPSIKLLGAAGVGITIERCEKLALIFAQKLIVFGGNAGPCKLRAGGKNPALWCLWWPAVSLATPPQ